MIFTYIQYYLLGILVLVIVDYIFHRLFITIHPTYVSGKKVERPPEFWGPFTTGEFAAWLFRSIGTPTWILLDNIIFPNEISTLHMNIVIGGCIILFIVIPTILIIKIDG